MLTGDILRRAAERFACKDTIIGEHLRYTYAELDTRADQLANALLDVTHGAPTLSPAWGGAKVAILSRNLPEYGVVFSGVARSGCVLVNVSVLYAPDELVAKAFEIANRLAAGSQTAIRWTKYALNNWLRMMGPTFDSSLALEFMGFAGPDVHEGVASHKERRKPTFDPDCPF